MASPLNKRPKLSNEDEKDGNIKTNPISTSIEDVFKAVVLYIHPDGIGPKRLEIMKRFATKSGFNLLSTMT